MAFCQKTNAIPGGFRLPQRAPSRQEPVGRGTAGGPLRTDADQADRCLDHFLVDYNSNKT
jgi:hypothetical protein